MTNKELLQSAKDEAAREINRDNWDEVTRLEPFSKLEIVITRALELYGDAQWNAAIEKAAATGVRVCKGYYEHEIYTSILKLKKP